MKSDRLKLYLDFDDVVMDTTRYLMRMLGETNPNRFWGIYGNDPRVVTELSENYKKIPIKKNALNGLRIVEKFADITFVSEYYYPGEARDKRILSKGFCRHSDIILVNANESRKYKLDLSKGMLIDDNSKILCMSNAGMKILFYNPANYITRFDGLRVEDWKGLIHLFKLMGMTEEVLV